MSTNTVELFVDPGKVWRSRFLAGFLMLNWGIMGWFTVRAPAWWSAALTLALGLIAFVGAVSQVRASRRAAEDPLVTWDPDHFRFRGYTQAQFVEIPWGRLKLNRAPNPTKGARPDGDYVEVTIGDDRIVFFGWPEPHLEPGEKPGVDDVAPRSILGLPMLAEADREQVLSVLKTRSRAA